MIRLWDAGAYCLGLLLALPAAAGPIASEAQRAELRQAFCAVKECTDTIYGGCEDAQCRRWALDLELERISEADRMRYQRDCLPHDCPIAMPGDAVMADRTLAELVDGWTQRTQGSRNAGCGEAVPDPFELLLPAEAQALEVSFEAALELIRCAHPESARVRSPRARNLAAWRNAQRCVEPSPSGAGCDGSPCNASAGEVAAWTTPRRNLCPRRDAGGNLEIYVCRSKPDHLEKRDSLTDRPAFGTVCPRDRELASSETAGTCRRLVSAPLPSAAARAALGCAPDAAGCALVLDVLPDSSAEPDLLPLVPGFHDHRGEGHPIVTTSPQLGWQAVSPSLDAAGEAVTVLYGSLAGDAVYLERYRPGAETPFDERILDGWVLADLHAEPRQSCHPRAVHRARGELAYLSRALLAEDPAARPLGRGGWLEVAAGRQQPVFRRCFRFRERPVCFEHRTPESVPPPPSEARTLAWRPDLGSPLLAGAAEDRRWRWMETYLALRPRPVPDGGRIGVVALDAGGGAGDPRPGSALIGVTGEPPILLRSDPAIPGGARIAPAGPVIGRYLAALGDPSSYRPQHSDDALRRVFRIAATAGSGILATDPVAGAGRDGGRSCVLRPDGPYCGVPGADFEALLAPGLAADELEAAGLGRFTTAFTHVAAAIDGSPVAAAGAWQASEAALEALTAAGAGARSLLLLAPRAAGDGEDAVLLESPAEAAPGPCHARVRRVPIPAPGPAAPRPAAPRQAGGLLRPFTLVPLGGSAGTACGEQVRGVVRSLAGEARLPRLGQVAAALEDGLGGDTEVYVGPPDPSRGGLQIAVVRTGARPGGAGARLSLVTDRLAATAYRPLPALAHLLLTGRPPAAAAGTPVGTLAQRAAVIDCFLARTCPDMARGAAEPISYFPDPGAQP